MVRRSHSIAIVDDDSDTVQLFGDVLTINGYKVAGFINPFLALEHVKKNHKEINLILCDYKMHYISGCDFARKIKAEINTTITIIIITAVTDIGLNPLKLQVYYKPLTMSKLIDIVKQNIIISSD